MKTLPKRLENAVTKLYNAFHANELDGMDCKHCAVGNLCNNSSSWAGSYNSLDAINTGYSAEELMNIEDLFMFGRISGENKWSVAFFQDKEIHFKGLCAVIEYLCKLDNVPNIMEIQSLFEFDENKKPLHELNF